MPSDMDSYLGIHTQALRVRSQRASLLAANLANADTPNYKARDIDFKHVMQRATAQVPSVRIKRTDPRHLTLPGTAPSLDIKYRAPQQASLDGNTVDAQVERSQFAENAIHYQAGLRFINGKISGMIKALRGE